MTYYKKIPTKKFYLEAKIYANQYIFTNISSLKFKELNNVVKVIKKFYGYKKKILLVGGSGFIGHNLALYLKKNAIHIL